MWLMDQIYVLLTIIHIMLKPLALVRATNNKRTIKNGARFVQDHTRNTVTLFQKVTPQFFKDKQKLEVKVGVMDKKLVSAADLAAIADLPSFEALRSQFLGLLKSNAAAFVRVLDAKVKKEQPAAPAA